MGKITITPPLLAASLAVLLSACGSDNGKNYSVAGASVDYAATLHRSEGGIPHIVADDWGSIGYGTGYAAAEDHFCEQSRNVLKFRGQLASEFGDVEGNLDSDYFFKLLEQSGIYDEEIETEFDDLFAGYAAGFNRYLSDTGIENLSDPSCVGASWVQTMTADDVRRMHLTPAFLPNFASLILPATPPEAVAVIDQAHNKNQRFAAVNPEKLSELKGLAVAKPVAKRPAVSREQALALASHANGLFNPSDKGSNGVAIGSELSSDGSSLLFTNPHLGWGEFDFRMYAMHQIIPGVSNMLGANQAQRAHVGFGTNGQVSWTNTVSTSKAYSFFQLELVPGNPLAYYFDGQEREIEAIEVSVDVLGQDQPSSHTFYRSHHGYMIGRFPWDQTQAFTLRIANEGARGFQGGASAMAASTTVRELKAAINQYQSTPGINTIAIDSSGETLYGDLGPVVNFSDQQLADCSTFYGVAYLGNSSDCEWNTDEDSAVDGLLGASKQASLIRSDYVTNSNDSFWLANPAAPLSAIPAIQGDIEDERTLRTRSGLSMIAKRAAGSDGLSGNRFDLDSLAALMLGNQNYAGQILRDDLVTLCENNPTVTVETVDIDISSACLVLADWDLHSELDSQGAHLFREFMREAEGGGDRWLPGSFNYTVAFDVNDPVNTPRGLDTSDNLEVLQALAKAVAKLADAGIALDTELGDLQSVTRNGQRIALPGGEEFEGVFNKMSLGFDAVDGGYPEVTGSSASWVMLTQLSGDEVTVKGLTAYSQSSNPASPHYADMTARLSTRDLIDIPFTLEAVEAAALSTMQLEETVQAAQ